MREVDRRPASHDRSVPGASCSTSSAYFDALNCPDRGTKSSNKLRRTLMCEVSCAAGQGMRADAAQLLSIHRREPV